jgi:hypothetical protein
MLVFRCQHWIEPLQSWGQDTDSGKYRPVPISSLLSAKKKAKKKLRIVSPPWCLGAGSSTARVASPAKAEPPPKFWRITVSCKEDIQLVEHKLRRLYSTIDGQGCQALLTTEYQQWKNTVLRHFLNHSGDAAGVRLLDASLSDNV